MTTVDDAAEAVRAARAAEDDAKTQLDEARRMLHAYLTARIRQDARFPPGVASRVNEADAALAAYNRAVTATSAAFLALSRLRQGEEDQDDARRTT